MRLIEGVGIPAFCNDRRCRIESVITLLIERDSFEAILGLLDIGAGSDFVIFEKDRASGFSLNVYITRE
jgi:hypothetical protein